jgi:aspartate aminotransferase-like enzyme
MTTPLNFPPGPIVVHDEVRHVMHQPAISHRSTAFAELLMDTKRRLCKLTGAHYVEILLGSGTLANDMVAAQLSMHSGTGLILSNGEFGDRLIDHAHRFGLRARTLAINWGTAFHASHIEAMLRRQPDTRWLWAVHCETSTGMLNDLTMLKMLCSRRQVALYIDCISSIGTVPVHLPGVTLATGVSGKGLGACPGLGLVFYHRAMAPSRSLPRYLDLGLYTTCGGVPFTQSSNLVAALRASLKHLVPAARYESIVEQSAWLRAELASLRFHMVVPEEHATPAVITIELPEDLNATAVGDELAEAGCLVSYQSDYLLTRNWIQICLMGEYTRPMLNALMLLMRRYRRLRPPVSTTHLFATRS